MKICFVCGDMEYAGTKIEKHHIIPTTIKPKWMKGTNVIDVCSKCHRGIHNGAKLLPGSSLWRRVSKMTYEVAKSSNQKHIEAFRSDVLRWTIMDRLETILSYREFLEWKEWKEMIKG